MRLRSDSFRPWQHLPSRVALGRSDGQGGATFAANRNPHLTFLDVPEGVKSFALWCVDPEAPSVGTDVNVPDRSVPLWLPRAEFFTGPSLICRPTCAQSPRPPTPTA